MSQRSIFLAHAAQRVTGELSQHPALSHYWQQLSVIMKGSTARGNADRYSDIDLVIYCDNRVRTAIVTGYHTSSKPTWNYSLTSTGCATPSSVVTFYRHFLHRAKIVQGLCRISYLLDAEPYPPDKWLVHYLRHTRFGKKHGSRIAGYAFGTAGTKSLHKHLALERYPVYSDAAELIRQVGLFIRRIHGDAPWIEQWYLYV